jgi:hypothetical protein
MQGAGAGIEFVAFPQHAAEIDRLIPSEAENQSDRLQT